MTGGEERTVAIDTSVLINLAIVGRLDLLGALEGYRFVVPLDALEEVERPAQRERVEAALTAGHLRKRKLSEPAVLEQRAALLREMGPGEAACLAVAAENGWLVACDDKRTVPRISRRLLGEGRILNTVGLFVLAIRQGHWSVEDADDAKALLEQNRFRVKFRSFRDVL